MNRRRVLLGKLRRLTNLMQRARTQEFAHHDFNMMDGKGRLLSVLHTHDGLTQRELGEALDIRPSSVGELVRKLEASGLVIRQNSEIDRRVMNVYLTQEGRDIVSNASCSQEELQADIFQGISDDEQESFTGILDKMISSLEERYEDDMPDDLPRGRGQGRNGKGRPGNGRGNRGMGRGKGRRIHDKG